MPEPDRLPAGRPADAELVWPGKRLPELPTDGGPIRLHHTDAFEPPAAEPDAFGPEARSLLVWGDSAVVMEALLERFRGRIDLVYLDPPFDAGATFTMRVPLGEREGREPPETLEAVAYRDVWGAGEDSYLQTLYERLALVRELLSENGSLFVHVDWRVAHLVRLLLDELFGAGERDGPGRPGFRNEIIWGYDGGGAPRNVYRRKHDNLFWYTRSGRWTFHPQFRPYTEKTRRRGLTAVKGDRYTLREEGASLQSWWTGPEVQKILSPTARENLKFPTQKPEALLERILRGHTDPGHLVADFFCGSGTTAAVAQRLGRRWIMADMSRQAVTTARKRLARLLQETPRPGVAPRPFDCFHVREEEVRRWRARCPDAEAVLRRACRPADASVRIEVPEPGVTPETARELAERARGAGCAELHLLAWEWPPELLPFLDSLEREPGLRVRLVRLPREITERNRPPLLFVEAARARAEWVREPDGSACVRLREFRPGLPLSPPAPEALRERARRAPFDFIDYWAVDFDYGALRDEEGRPVFRHTWHAGRRAPDRRLALRSEPRPVEAGWGTPAAAVKIVDLFGYETVALVRGG